MFKQERTDYRTKGGSSGNPSLKMEKKEKRKHHEAIERQPQAPGRKRGLERGKKKKVRGKRTSIGKANGGGWSNRRKKSKQYKGE